MNTLLRQLAHNFDESEVVNLTNCDREPIHIPSLIQPHGLLMILTEPDLRIAQVSANALEILGIAIDDLLDRPLGEFAGDELIKSIQACLDHNFEYPNPLRVEFADLGDRLPLVFNGIVHRAPTGEIVLELEPWESLAGSDFFQFYHQIKHNLAKIQTAQDLSALCDLVVQEVQALTGFDRVMIYRFSEQGDGTVIAETKQPDQEAFLGLRYPDSDIPKQAKHLYTLNWLRLIPDVNYQPTRLVSHRLPEAESPLQKAPLDMSYCALRSVSPIHIEYLQNMGVTASMSVSLIQNKKLWGLIACHHYTPKFVPYETRTVCEFLGQLMSTELVNKEANENLDYKLHLKTIQGQFVERLTKATGFVEELGYDHEALLDLTSAQGVAICDGDRLILIGETPDELAVKSLLTWLEAHLEQDLFVTDALPSVYAEAVEYQAIASGLMAITISKIQHRYVLWFRPEQLQTVTWAGDRDKPTQVAEDGSIRLLPRQSFSAWKEIVCGKSNPWLPCEVDSAIELRQIIVDIVLRQADKLAKINIDLELSNSELDAFAYIASHDLKEPLRGIHNYATFLLEDYGEILKGEGADKLHTLVKLTKRMESLIESLLKFSRLSRQELQMEPLDLNHLLQNVRELFAMNPQWQNSKIKIPRSLPLVRGDRLLIEEIFINLITNAFKYNDHSEKLVEIDWYVEQPKSPLVMIYVHDNGIGIREKHLESIFQIFKRLNSHSKYGGGTGAGLTIVKKIVERHKGNIQVQSIYGQGTTVSFTLPACDLNTAI
ncbi:MULTISPECIES: ATP-binding protein [Pseudanabaena]|uniref:ATP-binding protein n=1 Tax=Pseudanabaena TaxID=1152 RepID=UPI0024796E5C|nr:MULTISPECIES: ATP-binding protein [Pseudanabaena]MEA5486015.1 ATP-binding protein [Pseudanabaena sp. CCNP1317]WGS73016.1 ATP-binding protein [Pseudanabaena galeata CCNP1313]